ncbi:MAG TPA: hypothetical protein VK021_10400 [Flavobacteriaceae bacterium]|nr:hypothetical protein [Flavobacteriaceae bacterium]
MRFVLPLLLVFITVSCKESGEKENEIPQGTFEYELFFSEFGQHPDARTASVDVVIEGNKIEVLKNEKTDLPVDRVIIEGILLKHKSGIWVIGRTEDDKDADEVGGCTDGPIPIDFEKKLIEWC